MSAIELQGVTKRFGDVTAINQLNLAIEEGAVYGLIGPNGSGKSTVLNLLLDFIRPTAGHVSVFGHDIQDESLAVRKRVGIVPDGYSVYDRLTARQQLQFVADSKKADTDIDALLERVGLVADADRPAGAYSSGMKKRLILGMAIVGDPDLLIFDEPFRGLDPNAARILRETIATENERGTTILMASHLFEQVDAVCDHVGLLLDGELVATDTVEEIRTTADEETLWIAVDDPEHAAATVRDQDGVSVVTVEENAVAVTCERSVKMEVLSALEDANVTVHDFDIRTAPIEELFRTYAGDRG